MAYLELSYALPVDEDLSEIFIARLYELGFDSFSQEDTILKAYVHEKDFDAESLKSILNEPEFSEVRLLTHESLAEQNWNALWESNYQAVIINNKCRIRAPFHAADPAFEFDLLIEPKMSFGTAHHETTSQMLAMMLTLEFKNKSTLDMGSGTAVLAILARKKGAYPVVAVDNDEWAFNNALDNIKLNDTNDIKVVLGDAKDIGNQMFDIVIANINRNILLQDMPFYTAALAPNGLLMMSGFYEADLPLIQAKARELDMIYVRHTSVNQWVAVLFSK